MSSGYKKILKIFWHSDGCKVNLADLENMLEQLPPGFWQPCPDLEEADVAVLNTCTVTHKADADWRKTLSGWRRRRPSLPVVVSGCATVFQEERIAAFPNVRAVIRPGDFRTLHQVLEKLGASESEAGAAPQRFGRHRALVKIQDGCSSRCSYCIVSLVRGEERSLDEDQAIEVVKRKLDEGYQEVILCGINLGRYGRGTGTSLARLLESLRRIRQPSSRWRIRLSSIEPQEWTPELMETIGKCDFVCRHFHVPVQSGTDGILRSMRRPYRAEQASQVLEKLRLAFPEAALGSDLLVGFPGEDEEAFRRTMLFVENSPLNYLHVFAFSPRPGTEAERLPNRVQASAVRQRVRELRRLGWDRWQRFLGEGVGRRHMVVAEKYQNGQAEGRSEHYRRVVFEGVSIRTGELYEVRGESVAGDILRGRLENGNGR